MQPLRRILLATDFQAASRLAADAAIELAWTFNAHVTLLHVIEPVPAMPVAQEVERQVAERMMSALAGELESKKVCVDARVIEVGPRAATITRLAEYSGCDLILIGSGERTALDVYRPGKVAQAVIERAVPPVLAVKPGSPAVFRRILCPVDFSETARRGLRNAIRLASAFEAELTVLTVVPELSWVMRPLAPGEAPFVEGSTRAELAKAAERYHADWRGRFSEFLAGFDFGNVRWSTEVRAGDIAAQIVDAARQRQSELIVIGSTGRGGPLHALLGGVTRHVLHALPCSILTVKREDLWEDVSSDEQRMAQLLCAEGRALHEAGSHEAAIVKLRQALAHQPAYAPALELLTAAYERTGQSREAEAQRRRTAALRGALGLGEQRG